MRAGSNKNRGFTLIEVLVAFLILAFSLSALFSVFSGSLRSVRQGEAHAHATSVARSLLAALDADGFTGAEEKSGESDSGYRWRMEVSSIDQVEDGDFEPFLVTVSVTWGVLDRQSVNLSTVRLVRR